MGGKDSARAGAFPGGYLVLRSHFSLLVRSAVVPRGTRDCLAVVPSEPHSDFGIGDSGGNEDILE
jgi:hypothetical protein